nr:putative reverse transcriptase domain-containing protein [Tanacetum cinerariifolium]
MGVWVCAGEGGRDEGESWAEVGDAHLTGPAIVHETIEKINQIKKCIQAAHDRQKIYADRRCKPLEFQVGDKVILKVSSWKGVICFGKRWKLNLRYIRPFKILAKVGTVAYRLELPDQLSRVHSTFHVSNMKKCLFYEPLAILLDKIHIDDKLNFIKEAVEIMDREVKQLKQIRISIVKISWNSRRGLEFTWEREDQIKKKCPHLFANPASTSQLESFVIVIHFVEYLAHYFLKVLEALGSLWKLLEDLEASCRRASRFEEMAIETEKNVDNESRLVGVEISMAGLKTQVEGLESLDFDFKSKREDFRVALNTLSGDFKREIHDLRDLFIYEIIKILEEFGEEISILHQVIKDLQADMELCKWSLASDSGNTNHVLKLDVPKPSPFVGKREARAVDDFLIPRHYSGDVSMQISSEVHLLLILGLNLWRISRRWAKTELKQREVQDLSTAIARAEALIDFSTRRGSSKPKDQKVNQEKGGGEKTVQPKSRDCTKKASLNGLLAPEDKGVSDDGSMGLMKIINAIKAKTEYKGWLDLVNPDIRLIVLNLRLTGFVLLLIPVRLFVANDEAKRLGINATKGSGTIKAVNSLAKVIHGVAKDVRAKIKVWEGTIDLSIVPMDDFKVVLGLEFLDKVRAFPMSFANSLCILDGGNTCMVDTKCDAKSGAKTLSAMRFKKGFNKSEPCYLAVTRLETDEGSSKVEVPKAIERVLEEFKDVMPKELPKKLPHRRDVDHTIKMETGSKPLAKKDAIIYIIYMYVMKALKRCGGGARLSHKDGEVVRLVVVMEMKVVAMMQGGGVVVDVDGVEMG